MTQRLSLRRFTALGFGSLLLMASTLAFAGEGPDRSGGMGGNDGKPAGGGREPKKHLIADLAGATGTGAIDVLSTRKEMRFRAGVNLDIDGDVLPDLDTAANAELTLVLPQASCALAITSIHFEHTDAEVSATAEYAVSLGSRKTKKGNRVKAKVGSCQNTGSANAVDMPVVNPGDTVQVFMDDAEEPVLMGTFK